MKKSRAGCEKRIKWGHKNTCHDTNDLLVALIRDVTVISTSMLNAKCKRLTSVRL